MKKRKLGLALGSGAWRGLVHIGVLQGLEENGMEIEAIAGSSVGALIGGLWAYFGQSSKVEAIVKSLKFKDMFGVIWDKPFGKGAMIEGRKYDKFLRNIVGNIKIEELRVPFVAVCADMETGKLVEIKKGDLVEAIRASSAIPVVFRPVKIDGQMLVDGGAIRPVPAENCKKMGAKVVIGVSLYGGVFPVKRDIGQFTKFEMAKVARFLPLKSLADHDLTKADIAIEPKIVGEDYGLLANFVKNKQVIDCGRTAIEEKIELIRQKLL